MRSRWTSSFLGAVKCLLCVVHQADQSRRLRRGNNSSNNSGTSRKEPPPEGPLPEGLSTIQQLLYTLAQGQLAAHARLLEQAENSPGHMFKALEALKEQYRQDVKGINEKYMESKRRWRYSLSQAVAHRHMPEEATRFETEATMWRRQWENTSPELVEAARKVKNEHGPKVRLLWSLAVVIADSVASADHEGARCIRASAAQDDEQGRQRAAARRVQADLALAGMAWSVGNAALLRHPRPAAVAYTEADTPRPLRRVALCFCSHRCRAAFGFSDVCPTVHLKTQARLQGRTTFALSHLREVYLAAACRRCCVPSVRRRLDVSAPRSLPAPLAMAAPGAASMSDRFAVNSQLQHLQVWPADASLAARI